jgi:hypothetical protein
MKQNIIDFPTHFLSLASAERNEKKNRKRQPRKAEKKEKEESI